MPDKKRPVFAPALWSEVDAYAVKAWANGTATADQQKRSFHWVVTAAARAYDQSFVPGSPDVSAFLEGHRHVGNQILKLLNITPADIERGKTRTSPAVKRHVP